MSDYDFDFPSAGGGKDLAKVKSKIEELGKYLSKQGLCYHIFVTTKEAESSVSGKNGLMAAAGKMSMNAAAYITHVSSLMQDSNYRKAALIAVLLLKKGRIRVQHQSHDDDGFFSKLKKMF